MEWKNSLFYSGQGNLVNKSGILRRIREADMLKEQKGGHCDWNEMKE